MIKESEEPKNLGRPKKYETTSERNQYLSYKRYINDLVSGGGTNLKKFIKDEKVRKRYIEGREQMLTKYNEKYLIYINDSDEAAQLESEKNIKKVKEYWYISKWHKNDSFNNKDVDISKIQKNIEQLSKRKTLEIINMQYYQKEKDEIFVVRIKSKATINSIALSNYRRYGNIDIEKIPKKEQTEEKWHSLEEFEKKNGELHDYVQTLV